MEERGIDGETLQSQTSQNTSQLILSGGNAERGRQGVLRMRINVDEPKRGSQSAVTIIILANNKQWHMLVDHSPSHLQSAMQQECLATGNPSSAPSLSLALLPGQVNPGVVLAPVVQCSTGISKARQEYVGCATSPPTATTHQGKGSKILPGGPPSVGGRQGKSGTMLHQVQNVQLSSLLKYYKVT